MARQSAINLGATPNADGYSLAGGTTTRRTLTISGGDLPFIANAAGASITFDNTVATHVVDTTTAQSIAGVKTFGAYPVGPGTAPTTSQQLVDKAYVDNLVTSGTRFVGEANVATTAALAAGTYSNGSSGVGATFTVTATGVQSVDGVALTAGMTVLVKNQASAFQNGYYDVTTAGAVGVSLVLTRNVNYDSTAQAVTGTFFNVLQGTTNANTQWAMTTNSSITIGTTAINFSQLSTPSTVTASLGVKKVGNDLEADLDAAGAITLNTNSLKINVDAARAITIVANAIGVNVDNSTIAISGNTVIVKTGGITATQLAVGAVDLAGTKITGILPLGNGGTGANLTAPGANVLLGYDNTDSAVKFLTIGSGLSYNHASHTLSSTASGFAPIGTNTVTVNTTVTAVNTAYIPNAASTLQITLPTTASVGDEFLVLGNLNSGGLWQIKQNASQVIHFGNLDSTVGTGGTLTATNRWDMIHLKCVVANTDFQVISSQGNIDVV